MTGGGRDDAGAAVIVIVNWNGRDLLAACLDAALAQQYRPLRVVLVDNLSTDGSVEFVQQRFPAVHVLVNDVNNYARANNRGAALVDSEFVALLNTDALPAPDWLPTLVDCLRQDARCGAATGLVRFPDGRVNSTGVEALPGFAWRDRDFGGDGAEPRPSGVVDGVSGCAALWRRRCWEQIGGLDEDFEMYYEDVDASLRARAHGWRLRYCRQAEVVHGYNVSIVRRERSEHGTAPFRLKDQLGERNRLLILARHYPLAFASELPASRFFLEAGETDLAHGLDLALTRWQPALTPAMRGQLAHTLLGCRRMLTERESWARRSEVEVNKRELQVFDLLSRLDAIGVAADHARQRGEALERDLAEAARREQAAMGEVQRLDQEIRTIHAGYQAQQRRDAAEIEHLHATYQREIADRERRIEELRQALAAGLRWRSAGAECADLPGASA